TSWRRAQQLHRSRGDHEQRTGTVTGPIDPLSCDVAGSTDPPLERDEFVGGQRCEERRMGQRLEADRVPARGRGRRTGGQRKREVLWHGLPILSGCRRSEALPTLL